MKATALFLLAIVTYQQLVSCAPGECSTVTTPICESLTKASVTCKCSGSTGLCMLDGGEFSFACPPTESYKWGRDTCDDFCAKGGAYCDKSGCSNKIEIPIPDYKDLFPGE